MYTDVTNAEVPLDWLHSKGHLGKLFTVVDSGSIASRMWLIKLGASARPSHLMLFCLAAAAPTIQLYEGPTTSADGTPLTVLPVNRSLALPTPTGLTFFHTPTKSVNGTLLDSTGQVANVPCRIPSLAAEWVLNPSTNYLLLETHAGTVQTTIAAVLYEG